MAMTGTVKFFNGERGYGFIKPMMVDEMFSCISPRWNARG
jgi:cold shock CspA family protein